MSNLDKHIQAKQNKLDSLEQTLKDIQLQLANLSQELRVEQQLAKAQETIKKEFAGVKSQVAKLVKDACSCFEAEALDDMLTDLSEIVETVKSEYVSYQQSDRFLDSEVAEVEDEVIKTPSSFNDMPLLSTALPDKDDNQTIVTGGHILQYAERLGLEFEDLQRIQAALGVPGKFRKIENAAGAIAKTELTAAKFYSIAELLKPSKTLAVLNGNSAS